MIYSDFRTFQTDNDWPKIWKREFYSSWDNANYVGIPFLGSNRNIQTWKRNPLQCCSVTVTSASSKTILEEDLQDYLSKINVHNIGKGIRWDSSSLNSNPDPDPQPYSKLPVNFRIVQVIYWTSILSTKSSGNTSHWSGTFTAVRDTYKINWM